MDLLQVSEGDLKLIILEVLANLSENCTFRLLASQLIASQMAITNISENTKDSQGCFLSLVNPMNTSSIPRFTFSLVSLWTVQCNLPTTYHSRSKQIRIGFS